MRHSSLDFFREQTAKKRGMTLAQYKNWLASD